jgi:hypothetical protein
MRKLPEHEVQHTKTFRITKDEYQKLNALASSMNLTFADFIRNALKMYADKCIKEKRQQIGLFGKKGYNDKEIPLFEKGGGYSKELINILGYDLNKL